MNERTTIQDLSELVGRLARKRAEYQEKMTALDKQVEAVQTTLSLYRQEVGLPEPPKVTPISTSTTDVGLDEQRRLMLLNIASHKNGVLVIREASDHSIQAGLFRDKKQFRSQIYRLIERMGCWEKAKRGSYRLAPDYWRCPDGKLHDLQYIRNADGTGVYLCRNCRFQADKKTVKAKTDGGPLMNGNLPAVLDLTIQSNQSRLPSAS